MHRTLTSVSGRSRRGSGHTTKPSSTPSVWPYHIIIASRAQATGGDKSDIQVVLDELTRQHNEMRGALRALSEDWRAEGEWRHEDTLETDPGASPIQRTSVS
ncbi:hypothetical protein BDR05DRAFT_146495 [Suillus weaverae]|nr:hypothetical protein BDR05DRAFT_146495 [Suillus weaverae]